jgi:hypothetical protein
MLASGRKHGGIAVHFVAAKPTHTITAARIYVDNIAKFIVNAGSLDPVHRACHRSHSAVVHAWYSTSSIQNTPDHVQ